MTTMVTEVYDALLSAGADDAKARRAAEVLADYDGRFDKLERRIDGVEASLSRRIDGLDSKVDLVRTELGGRLTLLKWQLGILIAGVTAIILKLFI